VNVAPDGTPAGARVESPLGLGLDEQALDAARRWRFTPPGPIGAPPPVTVPISFLLPAKFSRWHLASVSFQPPEGVLRPVFLNEPYPPGPGVSNKAIDEGWVISAIPRSALVKVLFDVQKDGVPAKFRVLSASADLWGDEAIAVLRRWRFTPGVKDGEPVAVPCTVDLVWGGKVWTPETLAEVRESMRIAAEPQPKPNAPLAVEAAESQTEPTVTAAYIIDGDTPHSPYSVVISAMIGENGAPADIRLVRGLGPQFDSKALEAVRAWLVDGVSSRGPVLIELDFSRPVARRAVIR
jgi:TonB family protein